MDDAAPEQADQSLVGEILVKAERGDRAAIGRVRNLLFEVRRGAQATTADQALDLGAASVGLGVPEDAEAWVELARRHVLAAGQHARALNLVITSRSQRGHYADALQAIGEIDQLPQGASAGVLLSLAITAGQVEDKMGRPEDALRRYAAAERRIAGDAVDRELLAALEQARGAALNTLDRHEEAVAAYERALEISSVTHPGSLVNLGNALRELRRYGEAERRYLEASAAARDDELVQASALSNHARLLALQGDVKRARVMLRDAFAMRQTADPFGAAITAEELAKLAAGEADYDSAANWARSAITLRAATGQLPDAWLEDFSAAMHALVGLIADQPHVVGVTLLERLRGDDPGSWPATVSGVPDDALRHAAELLGGESAGHGTASPGRAVEDQWLLAFLRRILAVGPDLAFVELSERLTDANRVLDSARHILDESHWMGRKRRYEARRATLERPFALEVLQVMEARADELGVGSTSAADLRRLIQECMEDGVDTAFARLPEEFPNELINRFVMIGTWRESLQLVQAHPELADVGVESLEQLAAANRDPGQRVRLRQHIRVLRESRRLGAARAFARAPTADGAPLGTKYGLGDEGHDLASDADVAAAEKLVATLANTGDDELLRLATLALHEAELGNACATMQDGTDDPARLDRAARAFTRAGWHETAQIAVQRLGHAWLRTADGDQPTALRAAADAFRQALRGTYGPAQASVAGVWQGLGTALWELWRTGEQPPAILLEAQHAFEQALRAAPDDADPGRARQAAYALHDTANALLTLPLPRSTMMEVRQAKVRACRAVIAATDQRVSAGQATDAAAELTASLWAYQAAVEELCTLGEYGAALATAEHGRARGFLAQLQPSASALGDESDSTGSADELTAFLADLDPAAVVLAWYTTATECYAFVLRGGSREVRGLPTGLGAARVESFGQLAADTIWSRPEVPDEPLSPAWNTLMESLVPVAWRDLLADAQEIVLVPHGPLAGLPLHALPIGWLDGRCLLDVARVRYLPGLALGNRLVGRVIGGETALVIAYDAEQLAASPESEFEREARMVAAAADGSDLYLGPRARIAPVFEVGQRARLIHVAAHARFDGSSPLESGILLSDGTPGGTEVLTARDVLRLPVLPGPVVVLSGCETGRHSPDLTGESYGLVRAFLVAGASAVVASQWRVDSQATRALMEDFHAALQQAGDVAGALRTAALLLRDSPETCHPYYWAAFITVGA